MSLLEWVNAYIEHLNSFRQDLLEKTVSGNEIKCRYKDELTLFILQETFNPELFSRIKEGRTVVVCLNKKENVDFLAKNWQEFIQNSRLKIIFVNPGLNVHWAIIPSLHHKVCDPSTLKVGLMSVYENVPSA
jgi:hypothetical protein